MEDNQMELGQAGLSEEQQDYSTVVAVNVEGNTDGTEEAGLALPLLLLGVVIAVLAVGAGVYFFLTRRRKAREWGADMPDEIQVERTVAGNDWEEDGEKTTYSPVFDGEEEYPVTTAPDLVAPPEGVNDFEDPAAAQPQPSRPEPEEAPATEMINQTYSHPTFRIGRGATIGGRSEQQDSFYCSNWKDDAVLSQRGLVVAVADGIGGLKGGSQASTSAMASMQANFSRNVFPYSGSNKLLSLAGAAHTAVLRLNQSGMNCGCTLVTVLIEGWDMYMASVGDSRIYLYRAGGLITLNREHTLGRENADRMEMGRESIPTESLKKAKAITSYLGKSNIKLIDRNTEPIRLLPGDKIALMTDGVFGTLGEEEILAAIRKDPDTAAREMISSIDARRSPRQDNATVVIVSVE